MKNEVVMKDLQVTLACGISVDFTGHLDEPFDYIGSFADMISKHKTSKNPEIRNSSIAEIENRAIIYAHKALSGYNLRVMMADEALKLLMEKLSK